jgi:hypothetical protein
MTRRNWTTDEDAALQALLAKGKTAAVIAREMSRPESSVYSRTQVLALKAMPSPAKPGKAPPPKPFGRLRPCMCCKTIFNSAGPHNRLCSTCRRLEKTPFDF